MLAPAAEPFLLIGYNTPNSRHNCSNKRPCHRKDKCKYCWSRFKKFIKKQARHYYHPWDLTNHCIINILYRYCDPADALYSLNEIKSFFIKELGRTAKYLCVTSLAVREERTPWGGIELIIHPHFHLIVSTKISKKNVRRIIEKALPHIRFRVKIIYLCNSEACAEEAGYLLDQNLKVTLKYRVPRIRLITASRGFKTGKPQRAVYETYTHTMEF